ncbi:MAG: RsmD family RNA methyltransferase [Planctomycetes bacterium]|nr:RsmD family RNA methyltransferase [Planctomycetota bacterium]
MRIIAGIWKGRRLIAPPGLATRPLPDRIKQSLFDWLGQDLSGRTVADVCAGSGSFGIEAASRGADIVHLIEPGTHAQSVLRANCSALGNPKALVVHPRPFQSVLPTVRGLDLIFCDPPFPWFQQEPQTILDLLTLAKGAGVRGGSVLIRGERGQDLPTLPQGLRHEERRLYGRSWVSRLSVGG